MVGKQIEILYNKCPPESSTNMKSKTLSNICDAVCRSLHKIIRKAGEGRG
jgi:hypothetical protein